MSKSIIAYKNSLYTVIKDKLHIFYPDLFKWLEAPEWPPALVYDPATKTLSIQEKAKICQCPISDLMRTGCVCGGN